MQCMRNILRALVHRLLRQEEKYTPRRNHCYACNAHLCPNCKEPKHVSKTDTVYRWCPQCYTTVEKCQRCREPLSKKGNNLMWCRTPTVSKQMCHHLICQPCGRKFGGCTWHCSHPPKGGHGPMGRVHRRQERVEDRKGQMEGIPRLLCTGASEKDGKRSKAARK